jgi:hypothetical protein
MKISEVFDWIMATRCCAFYGRAVRDRSSESVTADRALLQRWLEQGLLRDDDRRLFDLQRSAVAVEA